VTSGGLATPLQPWQPWWATEAAAEVQLSPSGQAVVREVRPAAAAAAAGAAAPAGPGAAAGSALPRPPAAPLPPLSALTRATPSPALGWQLLDVLFAYCFVMLRYNGSWLEAAGEAAGQLLQLSAALAPPPPGAAQQPAAPPQEFTSAPACLAACLARALAPPAGDASLRALALGSLQQLPQLLQHGRPPVLLALADAQRLVHACQQEVEQQAGGGAAAAAAAGGRQAGAAAAQRPRRGADGGGAQLRACQAAARKLHFMAAWANEQPDQRFETLAQLAAAEYLQHAQPHHGAAPGALAGQQQLGAGGGAMQQLAPQREVPPLLAKPLIEEL
jgi:hypothetical protein